MMVKQLNKLDKTALFAGFGIFLILAISVLAQSSWLIYSDNSVMNVISLYQDKMDIQIAEWISFFGSPTVATVLSILIILFAIWYQQKYVEAIWSVAFLATTSLVGVLLKLLFARPRPLDKLVPASGFSFPSGHVLATMILIILFWHFMLPYVKKGFWQRTTEFLLIFWVLLVALSRVYLHVHFPSDTIASVCLALGMAAFTKLGLEPIRSERNYKHFFRS
ncbi:phosphatase PAP2 family protein [Oenococcus sicerae]|uniref:phosphatase PAP2 family protein n=1 Tax=Oenococcus sicerae TaxID=2203724 RepID=UPI0039EAECB6